jgi:hypothetical protein
VKWTIRIEVTQDGKGPTTCDIGTITRSTGDLLPEQIGLSLEEGRQLLHRIQMAIIGHQVHGYEIRRRSCNGCGRHQRIKDTRRKCVQTPFGAFRLRGRRYRVCQCQPRGIRRVLFPLGRSSRGVRPPRSGSSSQNWARRCRIERHRECCEPAASGGCEPAMPRFGGTRSRSAGIWRISE